MNELTEKKEWDFKDENVKRDSSGCYDFCYVSNDYATRYRNKKER